MRTTQALSEAIAAVVAEVKAMSDEEFRAELQKHADGDIASAIRETLMQRQDHCPHCECACTDCCICGGEGE